MKFAKLNPFIRNACIFERIKRNEECCARDSRIIYLISGEIAYAARKLSDEKDNYLKGRLAPGNLLLIPAGYAYSLKSKYARAAVIAFDATDDYKDEETFAPVLSSEFDTDTIHTKASLSPFDRVIKICDMESERDTFIRMSNLFTSAGGYYLAEISAILKALLLKIAALTEEGALPPSMLENLDAYIRENASEEISNTELGAIFGYHPFYISRMLKSKKGITLHQYVISYRLKRAMELLKNTDRPIAYIAEECGFTDASYFTKIFRKETGSTPKEYRNKFKEEFI